MTGTGGSGTGYSFAGAGLPTWLTLTSSGKLIGLPPASAVGMPIGFTVTLTDSNNNTVNANYTLIVNA